MESDLNKPEIKRITKAEKDFRMSEIINSNEKKAKLWRESRKHPKLREGNILTEEKRVWGTDNIVFRDPEDKDVKYWIDRCLHQMATIELSLSHDYHARNEANETKKGWWHFDRRK